MEEVHVIIAEKENFSFEKIELDRISLLSSPITTSSALRFRGRLDFDCFKRAIQATLPSCPWVIGVLSGSYDGACVIPRQKDEFTPNNIDVNDLSKGFLTCEYCNLVDVEYDPNKSMNIYLPQNVHIKMIRADLAMSNIDGLPIAAFRVMQYKNHFIIGYRLNHSFFDQSSIISYFCFLSKLYNIVVNNLTHVNSPSSIPLRKPRVHIIPEKAQFSSDSEFLAATPNGYTSESVVSAPFSVPLSITMSFSSEKIEEIKRENQQEIVSSNDLIHGVLLKAMARKAQRLRSDDYNDEKVRLFFARNMRKPLGLVGGEDIIGDYVRVQLFPSSSKFASQASVMELARENRKHLNSMSDAELREKYSQESQWFDQYGLHRQGFPNCDFMTDVNTIVVTNWTSFPYNEVIFGDDMTSPEELILEENPLLSIAGAFVRISFRKGLHEKKELVAILFTPSTELIEEIQYLSEETQMFRVI
eukprot:gene4138-4430_t